MRGLAGGAAVAVRGAIWGAGPGGAGGGLLKHGPELLLRITGVGGVACRILCRFHWHNRVIRGVVHGDVLEVEMGPPVPPPASPAGPVRHLGGLRG